MGAAGLWLQLDPGDGAPLWRLSAPHDAPGALRGQTQRIDLHPPAARGVEPAQRQVDKAGIAFRVAIHNRPIGLGNFAPLEQFPQLLQSLAMATQHQAARGVPVEAMGEGGRARQAEAQGLEMGFEIVAPLGATVHRDACGLVQHQHEGVPIDEASVQVFRRHAGQAIWQSVGLGRPDHRGDDLP